MGRVKGFIYCAMGERVQLDFFPSFFLLLRGKGVEVNGFFLPKYMKRWKKDKERGTFRVFWKCFFHCGEAREGKGVIFFTNSLWDGMRGVFSFFLC
jgi:hypothetical protein